MERTGRQLGQGVPFGSAAAEIATDICPLTPRFRMAHFIPKRSHLRETDESEAEPAPFERDDVLVIKAVISHLQSGTRSLIQDNVDVLGIPHALLPPFRNGTMLNVLCRDSSSQQSMLPLSGRIGLRSCQLCPIDFCILCHRNRCLETPQPVLEWGCNRGAVHRELLASRKRIRCRPKPLCPC